MFRKANQPVTHKHMFKFQLSHNFVQNSQISPSVFLRIKMRALIHTGDLKKKVFLLGYIKKKTTGTARSTFDDEWNLQLHLAPKFLYSLQRA